MEFVLENFLSPGDVLAMSAAIYSAKRAYPEIKIGVRTSCDAIYENNPDVVPAASLLEAKTIRMEYPLIHSCDRLPVHFLQGYSDFLSEQIGKPFRLATNRPHLYFSEQEKAWVNQVQDSFGFRGKYWLVSVTWKNDYTCKKIPRDTLQAVVDHFAGRVQFVAVGSAEHPRHHLNGVLDLVGKTDARQFLRLCLNAQGAIGPESFMHHVFGALQKPMVTLCSGFLPPSWVQYGSARILWKANAFACGRNGGKFACWAARVVPLRDGDAKDKNLCALPVFFDEPTAKCMAAIEPSEVISAVEDFVYLDA